MRLLTLMDDRPSANQALVHEHGLSMLLETETTRILFDCGASGIFCQNARHLGADLKNLDGVVLSHSHYDHAGGYKELLEAGLGSRVLYTGPGFFQKKYARDGIKYTDLSCGFTGEWLRNLGITHRICEDMVEIAPGIWLMGGFDRTHAMETIPGRFVREADSGNLSAQIEADRFEDEICLAAETAKGLVVITGCSHPGILNMMDTIHKRLNQPIYGVFGGIHLAKAEETRIRETVAVLKNMGLKILGFGHCSGELIEQIVAEDETVWGCHLAAGDLIIL
ncbi:MAG: MBL fold metallo-hydrolase [Lachnospiraceae bacterium]